MKLVSDDSRIFSPIFIIVVYGLDYVAKIRSELSITVLEKKTDENYRLK